MYYNSMGAEIIIYVESGWGGHDSEDNEVDQRFRGLIAIAATTGDNKGENSEGYILHAWIQKPGY